MNKNVFWYLFIVIWLFIILLFTWPEIKNWQALKAEKKELIEKENYINSEYEKYSKIKNEILNWGEKTEEIAKYTKEVKEDEVLTFIYSNIEKINATLTTQKISIKNLTISKPQINQMWLKESNINLSLEVPSEAKLKEILKFLTNNEEYKFFITSLNYTTENSGGLNWTGFSIQIPLKVFYKD